MQFCGQTSLALVKSLAAAFWTNFNLMLGSCLSIVQQSSLEDIKAWTTFSNILFLGWGISHLQWFSAGKNEALITELSFLSNFRLQSKNTPRCFTIGYWYGVRGTSTLLMSGEPKIITSVLSTLRLRKLIAIQSFISARQSKKVCSGSRGSQVGFAET